MRPRKPSGSKRGSGWKYNRLLYSSTAWSRESGDGTTPVAEEALFDTPSGTSCGLEGRAYHDAEAPSLMLTMFIRREVLSTIELVLFVCLGKESGVKTEPLLEEGA
jgi:hypothetical protein